MAVDEQTFQFCTLCGARSPETTTDYTLISAKFGWRLTRTKTAEGGYSLQWFCPKCWAKRKSDAGPPSSRG
jgi:hypothetical protein